MGIRDLHRLVETCAPTALRPMHCSDVRNTRWAIDANIYLYRFMSAKPHTARRHATRFEAFVRWLRSLGVVPIFVFDGESPSEKLEELEARRENKRSASRRLRDLKRGLVTVQHIQTRWRQLQFLLHAVAHIAPANAPPPPATRECNIVGRSALLQVVAELLECSTNTLLPPQLVQALFDGDAMLAQHETSALVSLVRFASLLHLNWYHADEVHIDWTSPEAESCDKAYAQPPILLGGDHEDVTATYVSVRTAAGSSLEHGTPLFDTSDDMATVQTNTVCDGAAAPAPLACRRRWFENLVHAALASAQPAEQLLICIHCTAETLNALEPTLNRFATVLQRQWSKQAKTRVALVVEGEALHWVVPSDPHLYPELARVEPLRANVICHDDKSGPPPPPPPRVARKRDVWEDRSFDGDALLLEVVGRDRYTGASTTMLVPPLVDWELFTNMTVDDAVCPPPTVTTLQDSDSAATTTSAIDTTAPSDRGVRAAIQCLDEAPLTLFDANGEALVRHLQAAVRKLEPQTTRVTGEQLDECYAALRALGVVVVHAEHEAEATCVRLCRAGLADHVVTEDLDAIPFGALSIVRKVAFANDGSTRPRVATSKNVVVAQHLDVAQVLRDIGMEPQQLVDVCIVCGCDFCDALPVGGYADALYLVRHCGTLEAVKAHLCKTHVPHTRSGALARHFRLDRAERARNLFLRNHSDRLPDGVAAQADVQRLLARTQSI